MITALTVFFCIIAGIVVISLVFGLLGAVLGITFGIFGSVIGFIFDVAFSPVGIIVLVILVLYLLTRKKSSG